MGEGKGLHPIVQGARERFDDLPTEQGDALLSYLSERFVELERERDAFARRVERAHDASQDRLTSVFRALSDGVCTLDAAGRCVSINVVAARYLGADQSAIVGERLLSRFKLSSNYASSPDVFDLLWTSLRERLALRFEQALLVRKDGSHLAVSCVFNPLIESGQVTGCVFVFRDVSAARRAEEELRRLNEELRHARDEAVEASKSKSTFLANMSHELRTPLNAIIGYAELVQEDVEELADGAHIVADINKIHTAADHLLHVINDILDVSKIEAGKMDVFVEAFDVCALVESVRDTVGGLVERNGNTLDVRCVEDIGVMHNDKMKLRQVLINLISNAAKFTSDGAITLRVWQERDPRGSWVVFELEDTGIGIPSDRIEHLFESFTQVDQSTTRRYGGTGLGLTITYQFCQMMGGEVTVASTLDVGSVFTVRLPLRLRFDEHGIASLSEDTSAQEDIAPLDISSDRHLVVCIDDDEQVAELIERFLPPDEFQVVHASGGTDGLQVLRRLRPAVITLDVMMPDMNGWSVLSRIKSDPELANIPVVMLSIVADRQRGYALGAADYLTKPIQRSRLVEVLRRYSSSQGEILVVEDDRETRDILRRVLESRGWLTIAARHGKEAMEILEQATPDVILLDLMMPEMDGFQVLDQLRAEERWRDIPVIVLTAMELTVPEINRLNQRVQQVFQKGSAPTELLIQQIIAVIRSGEP